MLRSEMPLAQGSGILYEPVPGLVDDCLRRKCGFPAWVIFSQVHQSAGGQSPDYHATKFNARKTASAISQRNQINGTAMRQKSSVPAATLKDWPDSKRSLAAWPNQTAEKVIRASEELFAKCGYNACTFKMISAKSKVNQGLIYYYFGSKENLFSEIFMRWAEPLARRRNMMLDELEGAAPGGRPELEDIIRAFIIPVLEVYERGQDGRAFLRIHAHLRTEPVTFALALRRKAFSASTERFLKLVRATCPHLSSAAVGWRFNAMIGAYQMAISRGGRVEDFFSATKTKIDMREALEQTIKFSVGGFLAEE